MCRALLSLLVAAGVILVGGPAWGDPVAAYRMLIDGVHAPVHRLEHGTTHTLSVEVRVTDNYLGEYDLGDGPKHYHGGVVMYSFNLDNTPDEDIEWDERIISFPPPPHPEGKWNSKAHPAFTTHMRGELHLTGRPEVFAETGHIVPDYYFTGGNFYRFGGAANAGEIGETEWAEVVRGDFTWLSETTEVALIPYSLDSTLIFTGGGHPGNEPPAEVLGDQTVLTLIPEPGTSILLAIGLLAVLGHVWRKRRCV